MYNYILQQYEVMLFCQFVVATYIDTVSLLANEPVGNKLELLVLHHILLVYRARPTLD